MSHPNKVKGTRFESEFVAFLNENGYPAAERRALHGTNDKGDTVGVPDWTLELKNEARYNLSGYMTEAQAEAKNAGTDLYAAVVKRRGKGAAQAFVIMPAEVWVKIAQVVKTEA